MYKNENAGGAKKVPAGCCVSLVESVVAACFLLDPAVQRARMQRNINLTRLARDSEVPSRETTLKTGRLDARGMRCFQFSMRRERKSAKIKTS